MLIWHCEELDLVFFFIITYSFPRAAASVVAFSVAVMERIKIDGHNRPPAKRNIYYVCNRERCFGCKTKPIRDCHHTTDIRFAAYDDHDPEEFDYDVENKSWWEKERNQ